MRTLLQDLAALDVTLFNIGGKPITTVSAVVLLLSVLALSVLARWSRYWLTRRLLRQSGLNISTRETIGVLLQYAVLLIGFTVIMQTAGIDLSSLSVFAGAVGVGIGFGLQNIVSNVISGLIVMFERPIRIGDRIEIGGFEGDVLAINARSTVLGTARGARVVVPNQKFITEYLRNWDVDNALDTTTLLLPYRLAPAQDFERIRQVLYEAALAVTGVEPKPAPQVFLTAVDSAAQSVELQVWLRGDAVARAQVQTALLQASHRALAEAGLRLA